VTAVLEDGARLIEKPTYPDDVLREGIVNAMIHRDYLMSSTDVELAVYINRLEIVSPD
jgi:ATP-dependent DNA helicase RecG